MFTLKPSPPYPETTPTLSMIPVPADLPDPVARYYRETCGEEVPLIESAVISGRAKMRLVGLTFPARFRFTHEAGHNYHHNIKFVNEFTQLMFGLGE